MTAPKLHVVGVGADDNDKISCLRKTSIALDALYGWLVEGVPVSTELVESLQAGFSLQNLNQALSDSPEGVLGCGTSTKGTILEIFHTTLGVNCYL